LSPDTAAPGAAAPAGGDPYRARRERLAAWLAGQGLEAAVLADFEGLRNASVRWLTGHPMDALLLVAASGEALLVPWDLALAERRARVERVEPYTRYQRSLRQALKGILPPRGLSRVELSGAFPYPLVRELSEALPGSHLECREEGLDAELALLRAVKDAEELASLRSACRLTDELAGEVERRLKTGGWKPTETELALFLEAEARQRGAEGMSFETLAAGPARSFAIHAFPPYTAAAFGAPGFSILDFGVCWEGYRSDVTLTAVRGPLAARQRKMREAVLAAYDRALPQVKPGASPRGIGEDSERFLAEAGFPLPHGLGHGIGLEAHEAPYLSTRPGGEMPLQAGMVLTVEPGAYDPESGGIRLENDVLVTRSGCELLTRARLLEL
jgi:Xaa-Pro dipeptidase